MEQPLVVLDPAVLVWSRPDYEARPNDYWELADDFVELLSLLDAVPSQLLFSSTLAELVIDEFPAAQLSKSALHDFIRVVYSFLARMQTEGVNFPRTQDISFSPDVCSRTHLCKNTSIELSATLAHALSRSEPGYFASHSTVFGFGERELIDRASPKKKVSISLATDDLSCLKDAVRRIYEANDKHHSTYGFGSRLPENASPQEIQEALDIAIELNSPGVLCAKIRTDNAVLVFRRHHQNRYHAYPVETWEFAKYGIKADSLPTLSARKEK